MSVSRSEQFRNLHSNRQVLVLVNIWDPASAVIVQASGATALATSSASLAWANGYADGSFLPSEVLLSAIDKILRVCKVPLTVDIEDGYSESPEEVANLVFRLTELGVAGVNIEDGRESASLLLKKIAATRKRLGSYDVFINARTDVYLQGLVAPEKRLTESIDRANQYIAEGADGAFIPAMTSHQDIKTVSSSVNAPLNIMVASVADDIDALKKAGASRISFGPTPFIEAYSTLCETSNKVLHPVNHIEALNYGVLNQMF